MTSSIVRSKAGFAGRQFARLVGNLAWAAIAFPALVSAQMQIHNLTLLPANPVEFEPVTARIEVRDVCFVDPQTIAVAQPLDRPGVIQVVVQNTPGCVILSRRGHYDVAIGSLPAGSYVVRLMYFDTEVAVLPLTVAHNPARNPAKYFPLVDYTDSWWNQAESGWGLFVVQHPSNQVFAGWFVYGADGKPTWFTMVPGEWNYYNTFTGPIYRTTGPYFGGPFDPTNVTRTIVGQGTLTFTDRNAGTFTYTVDGASATKAITRLPF